MLRLRIAQVVFALVLVGLTACEGGVPAQPVGQTPAAPSAQPSWQPTRIAAPPTALPTATATPVPTATPTPVPTQGEPLHFFPVQPAEAVSYEHYHHDYPANDIFGEVGLFFVAVTDGTIDEVNYEDRWDPETDDPAWRGGRFVSLIGDDGVRYYGSHLSAVEPGLEPGVRVQAGQTLGYIGMSGDARYTPPHLHFGISPPTFPGDWSVRRGTIDPYPYLQAWQNGENVTPVLED